MMKNISQTIKSIIRGTKVKYKIQYVMDGVGYEKIVLASSEEKARKLLIDEVLEHYPVSVCDIVNCVEEKKKGEKHV